MARSFRNPAPFLSPPQRRLYAPLTQRRPSSQPVTTRDRRRVTARPSGPEQRDGGKEALRPSEQWTCAHAGLCELSSIPHISWLQRHRQQAGFIQPPARPAQDRPVEGQAARMVAQSRRGFGRTNAAGLLCRSVRCPFATFNHPDTQPNSFVQNSIFGP